MNLPTCWLPGPTGSDVRWLCQTSAQPACQPITRDHSGDRGMHAALRIGVTVLMLGAPAGPAGAEMSVYYHIGSWDAFSGPGADGNMVCGIGSTNPVDNHSFS